jgi:hypothetical protein
MKLVVAHTCSKAPASSPSPRPAALPPASGTSDPGGPPGVMTTVDWTYGLAQQSYNLRCNKDGLMFAWSGSFHNIYIDAVDDCQMRASGAEVSPAAGAGSYSLVPNGAGTFYVKCTVGGLRRCAALQLCGSQLAGDGFHTLGMVRGQHRGASHRVPAALAAAPACRWAPTAPPAP